MFEHFLITSIWDTGIVLCCDIHTCVLSSVETDKDNDSVFVFFFFLLPSIFKTIEHAIFPHFPTTAIFLTSDSLNLSQATQQTALLAIVEDLYTAKEVCLSLCHHPTGHFRSIWHSEPTNLPLHLLRRDCLRPCILAVHILPQIMHSYLYTKSLGCVTHSTIASTVM